MTAHPATIDAMSRRRLPALLRTRPTLAIAAVVLGLVVLTALFAPLLAPHDPLSVQPALRFRPAGGDYLLGTDAFGRDILSRIMYGARASLLTGVGVTVLSISIGLSIGLLSGFFRTADAVIMRFMDGLMSIPGILLAIALVALWGASLPSVLLAITIPEIPRVARLSRSVVLAAREEPYVEAARVTGTPTWKIIVKHLMPNTMPPLIVQGTYICASAIMIEAILSFIGAGMSTEVPTWGNIIAEGRLYFQLRPGIVLWPGLVLSATILCINLLGDGARDFLDPRVGRSGSGQ
jgi:peptide/nickel transport system permease protein